MEIILEVEGGNWFTIVVGPLDTVYHAKLIVRHIHKIPYAHQTFVFNGQILPDYLLFYKSEIANGSRIQLLLPAAAPPQPIMHPPPPQPIMHPPTPQPTMHPPTPQPIMHPPTPTLPFGTPDCPQLMELNPMLFSYDSFEFGMQEFSSSTQVMPPQPDMTAAPPPALPFGTQDIPPSMNLNPVPYGYDSFAFGMQEFSSSTQVMPPQPDMTAAPPPAIPFGSQDIPPSMDLNPVPYGYDSFAFGMQEFSSSTQVMPPQPDMTAAPPPAPPFGSPDIPPSMDLNPTAYGYDSFAFGMPEFSSPPLASLPPLPPLASLPPPPSLELLPPLPPLASIPSSRSRKTKVKVAGRSSEGESRKLNLKVAGRSSDDESRKLNLKVAVSSSGSESRKLKVKVLPRHEKKKIEIEVDDDLDKVLVLKKKLEELHRTVQFRLPENGAYFFIHNQNVMHEEESFQWHEVKDGDTIETYDGYLSSLP